MDYIYVFIIGVVTSELAPLAIGLILVVISILLFIPSLILFIVGINKDKKSKEAKVISSEYKFDSFTGSETNPENKGKKMKKDKKIKKKKEKTQSVQEFTFDNFE